jgi:hypothetical protein
MTRLKPLPLAPRPFPDESARSWIGRVAARYDLTPPELVECLPGGRPADVSWHALTGWPLNSDLEDLLARVARLDRPVISALRVPMLGVPDPADWHRGSLAWCPACLREDVRRHGEAYERALWRLGCCFACPAHRRLLEHVCRECAFGCCRFAPVSGRQRLVCDRCLAPVDSPEACAPGSGLRLGKFGFMPSADLTRVGLELQSDLLSAFWGVAPAGPWQFGMAANRFALVIRDLVGMLAGQDCFPRFWRRDKSALTVQHAVFAELEPATGREVFGIIGSVLTDMAGGCPIRVRQAFLELCVGLDQSSVTADLPWFVSRLSENERQWLDATAQEWGPVLGHRVGEAVDVEDSRLHDATAAQDKARRDAAWAKAATKRFRAAAVKRIAARARRRAATRRARTGQSDARAQCGSAKASGP